MSTQLKLRRGTTAQHSTFTGASGEITIDTDKKTVVVHDGTTAGGRALPQFDSSGNLPIPTGTANGVAYLNGSKVLTSGSALTFDGTDLNVTGGITATGTVTLPSTTSIGDVSATELQYLNSVTSNVQDQINSKAPVDNPAFTGTVSLPAGGITFADASTQSTGGYTGFRNRIINGDMRIDQRNAGASVSPTTSVYVLDRWNAIMNAVGAKYSVQQNAGSVSPPTGFSNYLGVTSLGAYSVAAGEIMAVQQIIEGFNISDLAWGTTSAQAVTLSFWVRSSLTGTFGGAIRQGSGARSYPFSYTISSSNTWEQKTITIPGDTSGTYAANNTAGLILSFGLGAGSTYSGTAGSWAGTNYVSATGATSVVGTSGATFYITGVQLEKGSVATPFEFRTYGTELALCQRYYEYGQIDAVTQSPAAGSFSVPVYHKVTKRSSPTIVFNRISQAGTITSGATTLVFGYSGQDSFHANYILSGAGGGNVSENWTSSAEL